VLDLGGEEKVVDHVCGDLGVLGQLLQLAPLRLVGRRSAEQELGAGQHDGQRCPELVADVGDEVSLRRQGFAQRADGAAAERQAEHRGGQDAQGAGCQGEVGEPFGLLLLFDEVHDGGDAGPVGRFSDVGEERVATDVDA
jgi:hypothetical protein